MSDGNRGGGSGGGGGNKTVFRPSPLAGLKQNRGTEPPPPPGSFGGYGVPPPPPSPGDYGAPPPPAFGGYGSPPPPPTDPGYVPSGPALAPSRLAEDDVPLPATPRQVRNILLTEASPILALAAGVRAGRVRLPLPQLHSQASQAIAAFDRTVAAHYSEETRQRAKYALCATIDDIAQNLPGIGTDGAEWARRSLVVQFFHENIGGDRFWQLTDEMLRSPHENRDIIELYHACLAAGFEGRFRVMPDGRRRLQEIMARLQAALEHVRSLSPIELSPRWKGEKAPIGRVNVWTYAIVAGAVAAALLLLIYIALRLILMQTGEAPLDKLVGLQPEERLRLSREGGPPPVPEESAQAGRLAQFLAPEIQQGLVKVEEDAQTVRVRTTVGQLFQSASDQLEPGREALFRRIGEAIEEEQGSVTIEGHADSDQISSLTFPDNVALSTARAETVASIIRGTLSNPARVTSQGMGEAQPIASNDTAEGKSLNRRVEIIVPRRY